MSERHGPSRIVRRIALTLACLFALAVLSVVVWVRIAFNTEEVTAGAVQKSTTSQDGTIIAYEQLGAGPVAILVPGALTDRGGTARLAKHLSEHFTVINYDRRGRGKSGDTQPYAAGREVEDIKALIEATGGSAFVFGWSSGAVLGLDATSQLGPSIKKLYMYEPPFIVDASRPPMPEYLATQVSHLVSQGRRDDAVKLFFTEGMGIPPFGVTLMRFLMPGWSKMAGMAHTVPYDLAILAGTQTGKPFPARQWAGAAAPTLVAVGGRSEPFFHTGAKALALVIPNAQYRSLEGLDHGAVLLSPKTIAASVEKFFLDER